MHSGWRPSRGDGQPGYRRGTAQGGLGPRYADGGWLGKAGRLAERVLMCCGRYRSQPSEECRAQDWPLAKHRAGETGSDQYRRGGLHRGRARDGHETSTRRGSMGAGQDGRSGGAAQKRGGCESRSMAGLGQLGGEGVDEWVRGSMRDKKQARCAVMEWTDRG